MCKPHFVLFCFFIYPLTDTWVAPMRCSCGHCCWMWVSEGLPSARSLLLSSSGCAPGLVIADSCNPFPTPQPESLALRSSGPRLSLSVSHNFRTLSALRGQHNPAFLPWRSTTGCCLACSSFLLPCSPLSSSQVSLPSLSSTRLSPVPRPLQGPFSPLPHHPTLQTGLLLWHI